MREVRDEPASNRIGHLGKNDRDSGGDRLQRGHCRICVGNDHIGSERDQFGSRGARALSVPFRESIFDFDIAAFSPTKLFEPLFKCREPSFCFGIVFAKRTQNANLSNSVPLLTTRRERPRSHGTAEQTYELTSPHGRPRSLGLHHRTNSCQFSGSRFRQSMSALGHKQTYAPQQAMSALHPIATAKADMCSATSDVCYGPKADSCSAAKRIAI